MEANDIVLTWRWRRIPCVSLSEDRKPLHPLLLPARRPSSRHLRRSVAILKTNDEDIDGQRKTVPITNPQLTTPTHLDRPRPKIWRIWYVLPSFSRFRQSVGPLEATAFQSKSQWQVVLSAQPSAKAWRQSRCFDLTALSWSAGKERIGERKDVACVRSLYKSQHEDTNFRQRSRLFPVTLFALTIKTPGLDLSRLLRLVMDHIVQAAWNSLRTPHNCLTKLRDVAGKWTNIDP